MIETCESSSSCPLPLCPLVPQYNTCGKILEAGVDEVARGCLFGPVYAGAVILNPDVPLHKWLNDSKRVSKKRRAVVREWIEETALAWGVAFVDNDDIDRINIRNAAMEAMNLAIEKLKIKPTFLLVDGNYFQPGLYSKNIPFLTVIAGDAKYGNIAAASILAKEHHDEHIQRMILQDATLHEKYDIGKNVGYGTAKHIAGLKTNGSTRLHRQSFLKRILPVKVDLLDSDDET